MTSETTVMVDLTATTNNRSLSPIVPRPAAAVSLRVYARASGWGSTTPAVVAVKHGPAGATSFEPFDPVVEFSRNGVSKPLFVGDKPAFRIEVTTAGSGGNFLDQDAAFTLVFSDKAE